ncbi:MAG: hypothetical protein AB7J35_10160 [Dehalococcoidia bacterium]
MSTGEALGHPKMGAVGAAGQLALAAVLSVVGIIVVIRLAERDSSAADEAVLAPPTSFPHAEIVKVEVSDLRYVFLVKTVAEADTLRELLAGESIIRTVTNQTPRIGEVVVADNDAIAEAVRADVGTVGYGGGRAVWVVDLRGTTILVGD